MKFTAEQIQYLENNIEMVGLNIIRVKAHIKGGVWGNVGGSVWGYVRGNVWGDVKGSVEGDVGGYVLGDVKGDVLGGVEVGVLDRFLGGFKNTKDTI